MLPVPPEGLRHWRPEDAAALAAAWADPDIARWNDVPAGADPATWIAGAEQRWARRLALDLVILPPPELPPPELPPPELADRRAGVRGGHERADPAAGARPPELADRRAGVRGGHERADPAAGVAGEVGLSAFTTGPARAELGVWVAAQYRRTGVATAAVATVTSWALTELHLDQVWARTDLRNTAAGALFERLGWQRLGESAGTAVWSATAALLR